MSVILADYSDIPDLVRFAVSFRNGLQRTEPSESAFRSGIYHLLDSDDAEFLVYQNTDKEACGYILLRYFYSMWLPGLEARIEDLFVDEPYQKNGYGKKLVEFAIGHAKEKQCQSIFLDTNENNTVSNQIYQALGFVCESKRWQGGRQILYRRSLK